MKLRNPFKKSYSRDELELLSMLKKVRLFGKMSYKEISQFTPYLHNRSYKNGEVVFYRGDPAHALYIIKEGWVSLNMDVNDKLVSLTTLKEKQTIGDNTVLQSSKRIYSAIVESEQAEILVLPQINIFEIFDQNDKIKAKMLEAYAERSNEFVSDIFQTYKASYGFFDLAQVYQGLR